MLISDLNGMCVTLTLSRLMAYVAQTQSGIYRGKIIAETDQHLVQRVSAQTAVAHLKKLVGDQAELNADVAISYTADNARVRALPERSRTAEIAR